MQGLMMNQKAATPTKRQKAQEQTELKKENKRLAWRRKSAALYGERLLKKIERLHSKAGKIQMTDIVTAITELRSSYNLAALLEFASIPRSTYYYHCKKAQSEDKYKQEKAEIISYAINERAIFEQITEMLDKAFEKLPDDTGLILHSVQGWQYQNIRYQKWLSDKEIRQSMSRKGNCLDNAIMENFFGLLKSELLYLRDFCSFEGFQTELELYLEYYNHNQIKAWLGGLSPVQYRIKAGFAA